MTNPAPIERGAEWIDADEWLAYLQATGRCGSFDGSRQLNYSDAAKLAEVRELPYEHLSDGRTLICVGRLLAKLARGTLAYKSETGDQESKVRTLTAVPATTPSSS